MVENKPQEQLGRFTNKELKLIKSAFAEQTDLLIAIRKSLWGLELTEQEDVKLKSTLTPEIMSILKRCFYPELEGNMPIHQEIDLMMTLKIDDKDPEQAHPHIMARKLLMDYMKQQLEIMEKATSGQGAIKLNELGTITIDDSEENYVCLTARNSIVMHIDQQLNGIKLIAGEKEETEEEQLKRINANSNK